MWRAISICYIILYIYMRYYIGYIYIIINIISIWNHVNNDVKKRKTLYVYIIIIINYT